MLELLIVVAMVTIVAGMVIPKMTSVVQALRTAGDARDFNGNLLMAKMCAASNFAQTRVHTDLSADIVLGLLQGREVTIRNCELG